MTYGTLLFRIYLLSLIFLSHLCNLFQLFFIDNFYLSHVCFDKSVSYKGRKGADAVAGRHICNVCQVFSAQTAIQRAAIFGKSVRIEQEEKSFCKAGTDVLLGEVHRAVIRFADFYAQVFDEVMPNVEAFL